VLTQLLPEWFMNSKRDTVFALHFERVWLMSLLNIIYLTSGSCTIVFETDITYILDKSWASQWVMSSPWPSMMHKTFKSPGDG